jgi:hypothetical protein
LDCPFIEVGHFENTIVIDLEILTEIKKNFKMIFFNLELLNLRGKETGLRIEFTANVEKNRLGSFFQKIFNINNPFINKNSKLVKTKSRMFWDQNFLKKWS